MMYKSLKVIVPALQVLAFVGLLLLRPISVTNHKINFDLYLPANDLMMRLNYPVVAFWFCIDYVGNWLGLPKPDTPSGGAMFALIVAIVLLASVAVFWYGVVREFEMRRMGKSVLRFRGWLWSLLAIFMLLAVGCGALFSAYSDASVRIPLMLYTGSAIGLAFTLIPEILLLVWAIVLIGMSVVDLRRLLETIHMDDGLVN